MRRASLYDPFTGKENIDDKTKLAFLMSPAYCNMLRKMVVGLTADHKLTVTLLDPNHPELGFTDGKRVMINTLHEMFRKEPLKKVTEYCLALAVHESLHPLYSCFQCVQDANRKHPKDTDNMVQVRRELFNLLEDARIERIGAFKFPGVAYAIESLNEFLYENRGGQIDQMKDIEKILLWIMDYVSVDHCRARLDGDLAELWTKIKPLAVMAKYSDTCSGCYFYTKKIMRLLKPLIPEQDPVQSQQQKPQNTQGNDKDVDAKTGQTPPGGKGKSGKGNGKQQQSQAGSGSQESNGSQDMSQQNAAGSQIGNGNGKGSGQTQGQGQQGGTGSGEDALDEMLTRALNSSFNEHLQDVSDAAHDAAAVNKLRSDASNSYDVSPCFGTYQYLDQYCAVKDEVMPVANKLRTGLKNIINYNVDEMSRYLHAGRIDAKSLSRIPSGAICAKRIEKSDEADLNITVLVDLSGSMSGWNLENSIKSCVVMQEVCMALKIPFTVLGFKDGSKTRIMHFSNHLLRGRYAHTGIVRMCTGGGTPLNEALNYIPTLLGKQPEEDKLVIVITDGEPNGSPDDCAATVKRLSGTGKVYGLAIGGGRDALRRIFGSNCIMIDRLDLLPRELCRIVEKNLIRR